MKRVKCILLGLLVSVGLSANQMKGNFDEGRNTKSAASQSLTADEFSPKSPQEARLYTGQNANPQLNVMGTQSLQSSEIGQLLTSSAVNNPADKISPESDMIKRSDDIRKNAKFLTGGAGGRQCVKQTLSKSHFTNHYCEKDQQINKVCKQTANVKWTGSRSVEKRTLEFDYNSGIRLRTNYGRGGFFNGGILYLDFSFPENAVVTGYEYLFRNNNGWFHLSNMHFELFGIKHRVNGNSYNPVTVKADNLNIRVHRGDTYTATLGGVSVWIGTNGKKFITTTTNKLTVYYQVEVDSLKPEIEWVDSCQGANFEQAVSLGEQCTQKGETRTFFKDGKHFSLQSDCWEKQTEYLISDASDNECKKYDENPNCTVGERECVSSINGLCTRFQIKYQCQHTTKTDGMVCGDKFFCSDGSCADLENSKNTQFGHAVSQLASLAQAGQDVSLDSQNLRAFSGRPMACRKTGFGFSDCCKDSGWGHKAGLAQCNSEENVLGKAKEKGVVIYVGTYCDKKILKKCVRRKSSYCVFDNKLARIVQYQGRSGQLGIGFGGAKNPDCRGVSVDELQKLDFNAMDYSDFYEDLENNKDMPNKDNVIDYIRTNISSQLQQ